MEDIEICHCNNIYKQEIEHAIKTKGMASVAEIQYALRAGIICGRCIPEIKKLIDRA